MKIVEPSVTLEWITGNSEQRIERAARTCYKSDCSATPEDAESFIKRVAVQQGHESVVEHAVASFRIVCDRGISHEIVRHRIASYSQESTRYVGSCAKPRLAVVSLEEAVEAYESGLSMKKVASLSSGKFTEWDIYKALEAAGIPKRSQGNRGLRNQDAFEHIDTVEKAYLLGMLISDGSLRQDTGQVILTQHSDVGWYLRPLLESVLEGPVGMGQDRACYSFSFSGRKLADDLMAKGVVQDKTHKQTLDDVARMAAAVPSELVPSFLRGLMDGDGWVRFFNQREMVRTGSAQMGFGGQPYVIEWARAVVRTLVDYDAKIYSEGEFFSKFVVSHRGAVEKLCNLMYQGFRFPFGHPVKTFRVYEAVQSLPKEYASYGDSKFQVLMPTFDESGAFTVAHWDWAEAMDASERSYTSMRNRGCSPQVARSVLPTCLKTELVMTANFREWLHFLKLRTAKNAHPDMQVVARKVGAILAMHCPSLFGQYKDSSGGATLGA